MSTVLTFQVPNGKWAFAVSPDALAVGGMDFLNRDDALNAAKRVIERKGWEPLPPQNDPLVPTSDSIFLATAGSLTVSKGVTLPSATPMLRLVGDDE